jgi:primase-polymerase (primpol)-like protein
MPPKKPHRKSGQQPHKPNSSLFANIPSDLKTVARWVNWRIEIRNGKRQKIPIAPKTGYMASCADPQTWGTYAEALARYKSGAVRGIGFQLGDSYTGVDLDDCRDRKTGAIEAWAQEIIEGLNSYTELSPSDEGVHILAKGALPPCGRRKGQVEMYDADHFFTMTGAHLAGTPSTVEERQTTLTEIHAQIFGKNMTQSGESHASGPSTSSLFDAELIERASNAKNMEKFGPLWRGDFSAYESQSEADLALCMILAFWTGRNALRIDSLFRQSGLFRPKWDERHSADGRTYGQLTIEKAVERTGEVWIPSVTAASGSIAGPGIVKRSLTLFRPKKHLRRTRAGESIATPTVSTNLMAKSR